MVREVLPPFFRVGKPLMKPGGIDVPVLYLNFAVDRLHYDPERKIPLPKGCPGSSRPVRLRESKRK
ncbi:hypothetical protein [Thermococcus peptonophilus]|uniref:hypothetical protein n=1 Tax=Thermococcus peptonophilus TaxID=53952 RepID=UPI000A46AB18